MSLSQDNLLGHMVSNKDRNNKIFNATDSSVLQVVDRIKLLIFTWLKVKFTTLPFNYHGWWLSPFTLLGIG